MIRSAVDFGYHLTAILQDKAMTWADFVAAIEARDATIRVDQARRDATSRDQRQVETHNWCVAAFGHDQASSVPQRCVRLLEEAVEAYQAGGCTEEMAHRLVSFVFSRPSGDLSQELGGVGLTALALAAAIGCSADRAEAQELARVLAKPLAHFKARNEAKNEAGFEAIERRVGIGKEKGDD